MVSDICTRCGELRTRHGHCRDPKFPESPAEKVERAFRERWQWPESSWKRQPNGLVLFIDEVNGT